MPARIPKNIEGRVNERTTPATAMLDEERLKTTIRSTKFRRFMENWEKNSEIRRNRKEGVVRARINGLRIKI